MTLSQDLRQEHDELWERMVRHPFVLGLGDGTLPRRAFAAYVEQDYLFIGSLVRLTAFGAAKAPDIPSAKPFGDFLGTLLGAEDALFRSFYEGLSLEWPPKPATPLPVTHRFARFLERTGAGKTFHEIATVLAVTEGTYADWAQRLVAEGRVPDDPLYRGWIDIHAVPGLAAFARTLEGFVDATPSEKRDAVSRTYARALRDEVAFWNAFLPEGHQGPEKRRR